MRSPKPMVSAIVLCSAALVGYLTLTPSVSSSGTPIARAAAADSTVVTHRVRAGVKSLDIATPSADGAFASSIDWDTGDLTVNDLRDGSVRRLYVQRDSSSDYDAYVESSRISPDGRRVAFAWIDEHSTYSVRVANADGSAPPREVYRDPKYWYLEVDGFAPDNRHVLLELDRHDGLFDYGMLDLDGGTLRPLFTGVPWVMGWVAFSPDGHYLLYTPRVEGPTYERRTPTVLDLSTAQTWPLVQWQTGAEHFAFTPDGKGVVLQSDRGGTPGLWLQPVHDGHATGEPRLLKSDVWNASGIGITRDGRALYLVRTGERRVYQARLDSAIGSLTSSPTRVADEYANYMTAVAVSPDGEWLAYNVAPGPWVFQGSPILTLRALATGETRQLRARLNRVEQQMLWSPDGKRLLVRGESAGGRFGVFLVDVADGAATTVRLDDSANPQIPAANGIGWSRDGRALIQVNETDSTQTLGAFDPATGRITTVARRPAARRFTPRLTRVASDGETVAGLVSTGRAGEYALVVGDFAGTRSRELMRMRPPDPIFGFAWSPDARWLYVQRGSNAAGAGARVDRVRVADGVVQSTGLHIVGRFGPFVVHPDGARLFFVSGEYDVELWAMEHFMAPTP